MKYLLCFVLPAVALSVVFTACNPNDGQDVQVLNDSSTLPSMEAILTELEGKTMVLVEWSSVEELPGYTDEHGREIEISFLPEGRFGAQGPINRIGGSLRVADDGYLEFEKNMFSTKMAGPPELMDLEVKFLGELSAVREVTRDMDSIVFVTDDGVSMRFVEDASKSENEP